MNAIRSDEELGNLHSLYVDQWDWERVMSPKERNIEFLKETVRRIYAAMVRTEYLVYEMFPQIRPTLPQQIHFIHSEDLLQKYPTCLLYTSDAAKISYLYTERTGRRYCQRIRSSIHHRHRMSVKQRGET